MTSRFARATSEGAPLAVYVADERYRQKVEKAAPAGREVKAVDDWESFERAAAASECSVVVIPWLDAKPETRRLAIFKARHPLHPVVLVTRGDIENARALKDLSVDEVVWLGEMERELADAVGRTCVLRQTRSLADALRGAAHLPARLREALASACEYERPLRTVEKLAASAGCDRRTLWHQWKQAVDGGALRLQDFLHWLLLLRAAGRKTAGRPWSEVAEDVGVHPDTLGRLARQLTGRTLGQLSAGGQADVAAQFERRVLPSLLPERGPDKLPSIGQSAVGQERKVA
jgi:hypothetical protein